jgi:hypothetical protein
LDDDITEPKDFLAIQRLYPRLTHIVALNSDLEPEKGFFLVRSGPSYKTFDEMNDWKESHDDTVGLNGWNECDKLCSVCTDFQKSNQETRGLCTSPERGLQIVQKICYLHWTLRIKKQKALNTPIDIESLFDEQDRVIKAFQLMTLEDELRKRAGMPNSRRRSDFLWELELTLRPWAKLVDKSSTMVHKMVQHPLFKALLSGR